MTIFEYDAWDLYPKVAPALAKQDDRLLRLGGAAQERKLSLGSVRFGSG